MPSARNLVVRRRRCLDRCLRPAAHMRAAQAAQKTGVACSPRKVDRWQRSSLHQLELCRVCYSLGVATPSSSSPLARLVAGDPWLSVHPSTHFRSRLAGIAERGAVGTFVFGKSSTLLSVHHLASSNAAPPPDSLWLCLPSPLLQSSGSAAGGPGLRTQRKGGAAGGLARTLTTLAKSQLRSSGSGPRCWRRWADRQRHGCSWWTAP